MQTIVHHLKVLISVTRGIPAVECFCLLLLNFYGKVSEGKIKAMDKQFYVAKFMKILETVTLWQVAFKDVCNRKTLHTEFF